jgi:CubicO group peptidase (beta-lactamase class C family)/Tol biopolymer transport system component
MWRDLLCGALLLAPLLLAAQTPARRSIDFSTREGTWMSVDVTRDGRRVVFDLLGDLYSVPIAGGPALPIVTGTDFASQPRVSPDGRSLVFVSDRSGSDNLWIAAVDGAGARQLTTLPRSVLISPVWSADGRSVFATVITGYFPFIADLWEFDATTGEGVKLIENANGPTSQLVSEPAPGPYGAAVSPDGRYVFVASITPRAYNSRTGTVSRLMRYERATKQSDPVVVEGTNPMRPLLSPDGALLVYGAESGGRTGLRVRRVSDGSERRLRLPVDRNALESRATRDMLPGYAFLPDARSLVVSYAGGLHRIDIETGAATPIPFEARVQQSVATTLRAPQRISDGPVRARTVQHPHRTADGRLVFAALTRVYVQDRAGAAPRRLSTTVHPREYWPTVSRNGQQVAYTTWDATGGHLWVARTDGRGAPRRVTGTPAFYAEPAFTPDGHEIVMLRAPIGSARLQPQVIPSDAELVRIPVAGGTPRVIAPANGARRPHFGPLSDRVFTFSGAAGLVSMRLDGTDRRVVAVPARRGPGLRALLSPTGDAIAFGVGNSLLRLPFAPALGSEPVSLDTSSPGARTIATDTPESFSWSTDGRALTWATGAVVHEDRTTASGGLVDSAAVVVDVPRDAARGVVVLRDVRAITMRGTEVLEHADLVITNNRITSIGQTGTVPIPAGATVRALAGCTVIPGLIDVHAHWGVPGEMVKPDATAPLANLAYGVTTVRDPQSAAEIFAWADLADAGEMPSPRIYSTGPGLFADLNFASLDQARETIRRYRTRYGTHLLKSYYLGNRQQRQWVVQASAELGMMPTTEGASDTRVDLTHAMDGYSGTEHALPDTPLYRDVVQLLAQSGIAYTPTLLVAFGGPFPIFQLLQNENPAADAKLRRWFPPDELYQRSATRQLWSRPEDSRAADQARDATAILRAGGLVALGGHGEMQGLQHHWEMRLLTDGGMTPHEALRVGTINSATAIGLDADLGSLEAGKLADLVILDQNPLDDIRATTAIRHVMRNGVMYDAETLDRIWPDSTHLTAPWWHQRAAGEGDAGNVIERIDAAVLAQLSAQRIPAAGVSVLQGERVLLSKGYGTANIEHRVAATDETMFESGSLGKQFTAAGVMALVEDGTVQLDASVRTYFPEAPPTWQPITIRQLLSHTSGLPDYTGDRFDYRKDYTEADLLQLAYGTTLEFPAGARWNYSNTGYVVLGALITKVTGAPYWQYLRSRIFTPAGMPTIRVITESEIVPHRAAGYLPTATGWRHQDWVAPLLNTTADGSMLLSARDLAAWSRVVRNRAVLKPDSWAQILAPVTLRSGTPYPYGFGWFVDSLRGRVVYQHGGSWQGFRTQIYRYEAADLTIAVLTNSGAANPGVIATDIATVMDSTLAPIPAPREPLRDTDPQVTARLRTVLERSARQEVQPSDFPYLRQTLFPRLKAANARTLQGLTSPDRLVLVSRRLLGDDTEFIYLAGYGARVFRVTMTLAPDGGIAWLIVRPE